MWLTQLRQAQAMETWEGQLLSVPATTPISHADVGDVRQKSKNFKFGGTRLGFRTPQWGHCPKMARSPISLAQSFPTKLFERKHVVMCIFTDSSL